MLTVGNLLAFDAAPVVQEISISPYSESTRVAFVAKPVISAHL